MKNPLFYRVKTLRTPVKIVQYFCILQVSSLETIWYVRIQSLDYGGKCSGFVVSKWTDKRDVIFLWTKHGTDLKGTEKK